MQENDMPEFFDVPIEQPKETAIQDVEFTVTEAMPSKANTYLQITTQYFRGMVIPEKREYNKFIERVKTLIDFSREPSEYLYSWPVKKPDGTIELIDGPGIELAKAMLSEWRFCHVVVDNPIPQTFKTPKGPKEGFLFRVSIIDAISANVYEDIYPKVIVQPPGKFAEKDENAIKWFQLQFSDGKSRCLRNAILKMIPGPIVDDIVDHVKGTLRLKIESEMKSKPGGDKSVQERLFTELKKYMSENDIKSNFGIKKLEYDYYLPIEKVVKMAIHLKTLKEESKVGESKKTENGKGTIWQKILTKAINDREKLDYLQKYVDVSLGEAEIILSLEALNSNIQTEIKKHFGE